MIQNALNLLLLLMLVVAVVGVAAERLAVPSPPVMLLAGCALAFVPGLPHLQSTPDIVLLVFLPPLLYTAAVNASWRGFRSNARPILLLAVGCVIFTAAAVAAAVHYALGFGWAVGFAMGAIVSPPDAVIVVALLRRVRIPRRIATILEGESLANDATALVLLAFALEAVGTGAFSLTRAVAEFAAICAGEIAYGAALGWAVLRARRAARSPRAEILLAFATPFLAFWPAHAVGGSGVIASVAAGLYVSWNGRCFISPETRLQGYFVWDLVAWATESMIFVVAGLQAVDMLEALHHAGWRQALLAGAIVAATVIAVRFLWVYPSAWLSRLHPAIRRVDPPPGWRFLFLISFAGLRGVDSLVAMLLVPEMVNGAPFPHRDLIVFSTFFVIGVSLLALGPALKPVVEWLGLARVGEVEAAANRVDEHAARAAARAAAHRARRETASDLDVLAVERAVIGRAYDDNRITDEARRRMEREFDLRQAIIRHEQAERSET